MDNQKDVPVRDVLSGSLRRKVVHLNSKESFQLHRTHTHMTSQQRNDLRMLERQRSDLEKLLTRYRPSSSSSVDGDDTAVNDDDDDDVFGTNDVTDEVVTSPKRSPKSSVSDGKKRKALDSNTPPPTPTAKSTPTVTMSNSWDRGAWLRSLKAKSQPEQSMCQALSDLTIIRPSSVSEDTLHSKEHSIPAYHGGRRNTVADILSDDKMQYGGGEKKYQIIPGCAAMSIRERLMKSRVGDSCKEIIPSWKIELERRRSRPASDDVMQLAALASGCRSLTASSADHSKAADGTTASNSTKSQPTYMKHTNASRRRSHRE